MWMPSDKYTEIVIDRHIRARAANIGSGYTAAGNATIDMRRRGHSIDATRNATRKQRRRPKGLIAIEK